MMIDGFHAEGRVMWRGARIGGDLSMGRERSASYREETQRKESKIDGELDLRGAVIAGSLELGGAALNNAGSWAINAAGVQIGRDLTIRSENFLTQVQGGLRFEGARIEGEVLWDGLQFSGAGPGRTLISLADAQITRALKPKRLIVAESVREKPRKGETALLIDLAGAHCAALDDDLDQGWGPVSVHLAMDGFVYQRLQREKRTEKGTDSSDRWKKRKKWMRERFQRYEGYHAQPYAHLARLYGEAGWYDDMRQVLWHRQVQQLRHEERRIWVRPFLHLHDLVAGFGHAPHRAAISLIAFLVIGTIGFEIANRRGALVVDVKAVAVNADKPLTSMPSPPACGREISPALYALDVAIPLLDLMQESECEPGKAPGAKLFEGVHIPAFKLRLLEEVEVWRWAKALYGILGAILTAVSVLTFTGVMRTVRLD
jgi:hypothetical protein